VVQRKGTASLRMTETENYSFNEATSQQTQKGTASAGQTVPRLHFFDAANGMKDQGKGLLHSHTINDFDISDGNRFGPTATYFLTMLKNSVF
jgi:hypothetical protein